MLLQLIFSSDTCLLLEELERGGVQGVEAGIQRCAGKSQTVLNTWHYKLANLSFKCHS
jgi:hypothetical protein